ncbi:unnamed protein product [Acanthoscelides obtectus]|uniref:NADH dehydrogenase [ubiquinone] 1 alpha subcomplex subunit 1 n=1 Tax=Acanthoscelides obtectus TaxID=200917 RepID=A0A9P0LY64_ACAOB|nr:unnamed protein product [Acanthoscelides obtectus]CAK1619939.1 hypothetical protein AOBTE_LOCUS93 [Acanthoscelides obtectus]
MWFEIIPSFAIITAAMAAPHGIAYVMNYVVVGNLFRRSLDTFEQRKQYLRDRRLSKGAGDRWGDPYKVIGLENIPDEEEHQCMCGCGGKKIEEENQGEQK